MSGIPAKLAQKPAASAAQRNEPDSGAKNRARLARKSAPATIEAIAEGLARVIYITSLSTMRTVIEAKIELSNSSCNLLGLRGV